MTRAHPAPHTAFIALGSNQGDRRATLDSAVAHLTHPGRIDVIAVSPFIETRAVGPGVQGPYLNAAARLECSIGPRELLQALLSIEAAHGRVRRPAERWGPRTLDLDLLLYDDLVIDEPGLTVPHPRMHERTFVLEPLAEIAPDIVHPRLGLRVESLLAAAQGVSAEAPVVDLPGGEPRMPKPAVVIRTLVLALLLSPAAACADAGGDEIKDAEKLLAESSAAYRGATALTDDVTITMQGPMGRIEDRISVAVEADGDTRIAFSNMVFTRIGDTVYVTRSDRDGKYLAVEFRENLPESLRELALVPLPQLAVRDGDGLEDWVAAFGMGLVESLELSGHKTLELNGRNVREVQVTGPDAVTVSARFDAETRLLTSAELFNGTATLTLQMEPRRLESLPQPVAFDVADKRQVSGVGDLDLGAGDLAPVFTLETLDGKTVRLADLRGQVVVVDFWATWCGPCIYGLPLLQQFETWASGEKLEVRVLPVDIGERQPTNQAKRDLVSRFWKSKSFTMTTLMDYDNKVATLYEVNQIPHTVVIGPDGRIIEVERGFNRGLVSHLQELTRKALGI